MRGKAKIADLGLAVFVGASSLSKTASGTMGYIAPEAYGDFESKPEGERARGRLTATVDIYAFAATTIKLATGRDPFGSTPPVIIENQKTGHADTTGLTQAVAAGATATFTHAGKAAMSNASLNACQGDIFTLPVTLTATT